ncbi:hypothetical protein OKW46_005681 [Paraburkholderia sp. WSM4179]|nr:hypothetical protein [Paraburkholderia sp. WSM4179]
MRAKPPVTEFEVLANATLKISFRPSGMSMPRLRLPCSLPVARVPELSTEATAVHGFVRFTVTTTTLSPGTSAGSIFMSTS